MPGISPCTVPGDSSGSLSRSETLREAGLAEIASESDLPLEDRLGPPAVYAEELMAAYGGRSESRPKRRPWDWAFTAHAAFTRQGAYRSSVAFLRDLRPGWWVLRGYLLAMLLLSLSGQDRVVPGSPADCAVVVAGVWASVWFGRRRRGRLAGVLATGINVVAALMLLAGLMMAQPANYDAPQPIAMSEPAAGVVLAGATPSDGFYNIKPYAKDGTPLTDVYLYDQDGKPVITNPEDYGYTVDRSCGEPILNRYPLPLITEGPVDNESMASPAPTCPASTPSSTPVPVPTK